MTVVVEAHAVDDRLVTGQAVKPRRGIAFLWPGCHRADLDRAEPQAEKTGDGLRVLVESGGHAERVREFEARDSCRKPLVGRQMRPRAVAGSKRLDRQIVGGFGRQREQQVAAEIIKPVAHASNSGKV
jgi:hypothetical protein